MVDVGRRLVLCWCRLPKLRNPPSPTLGRYWKLRHQMMAQSDDLGIETPQDRMILGSRCGSGRLAGGTNSRPGSFAGTPISGAALSLHGETICEERSALWVMVRKVR
jgi:hypothetical protein